MTRFRCEMCDRFVPSDLPSLAGDDRPDDELCLNCQRGMVLAEFYDAEQWVARRPEHSVEGRAPETLEHHGVTYRLSERDRNIATYIR